MLPALADVHVQVQADRNQIYLGESFLLYVKLSGDEAGEAELDLSRLPPAEMERYGAQRSQSMTIVNGKVTRDTSVSYPIAVRPKEAGAYRTGPVRVTAGGRTLQAEGPVVSVTGIEAQDVVRVSVAASGDTLLVDEPFTVTLTLSVAAIPLPYERVEPFSPSLPPHLDVDFLDPAEVRGLQGPDIAAKLNALVSRKNREPAFTINDYRSRGMGFFGMGMPFQEDPVRFRFPPKRLDSPEGPRWEYSVTLDYVAKREGDYTFGPATFKGKVITGADAGGNALFRDVFAVGPAATVRVVPPPEEGRPDCFVGSVGRGMTVRAELDANDCKVGDPLLLDIHVAGAISLDNLRPPVLSIQPGIVEDFRVYEDEVDSSPVPGGRRFRYRVRPLRAGTLEFPPVEIAYYDIGKRGYEIVRTDPIPLQVHATTQIASEPFEEPGNGGEDGAEPDASPAPAGITLSPEGAGVQPLLPPLRRMVAMLAIPPAAVLFAGLLGALRRSRERWVRLFVRGRARPRALRGISAARRECAGDGAAMAEGFSAALRSFVGTRCKVEGRALSPGEVAAHLRAAGVPGETAEEAASLLSRLDACAFQRGSVSPEEVAALEPALGALLARLEKRSRKVRGGGAALVLLLLVVSSATPLAAGDARMRFSWDRANLAMARASTPEAYHEAALLYAEMVEEGARNAPLFENLGTALLLSGDAAGAREAFARAARYGGATPALGRNLRLAEAAVQGRDNASIPWTHVVFFWHHGLSTRVRADIALAAWALLWLGVLIARPFRRRAGVPDGSTGSAGRVLIFAGAFFSLVFGVSVLLSCLNERHAANPVPAAVAEAEAAAAQVPEPAGG
ncbi:MAG: BatD family protein [Kiritimatiellia bacterium]